jgi:hypothetical protein
MGGYFLDVVGASRNLLFVVGALIACALIAGVVALFAFGSHGGSAVQATRVQPAAAASVPPRGALVLAGAAGQRAVALAVQRGNRAQARLTATVLSGNGPPESGLDVSFRLGGSTLRAHPCGSGCYSALAPSRASLGRVEVLVPNGPVSFRIPATTRPGAAIVRRATRVFDRLRTLVYVESLRSGPKGGIVTTWRFKAPDLLSYQIHGGAAAVVIGRRRWDQTRPGGRWVKSETTVLRVPQATWSADVRNAEVLGSARVGGRPVWLVSFMTPSVPAWFTAWIDKRSYRTLRMRMTAAAHFMYHRYVGFDRPVRIKPPS